MRDGMFGLPGEVRSGEQIPRHSRSIEGGANIVNKRFAMIVSVLGDDIRFDKSGAIAKIPMQLARSMAMRSENDVLSQVLDRSNYVRLADLDNDFGPNTSAQTFSAVGFDEAYRTIASVRDRTSGMPSMMSPDTLVCGHATWPHAVRLLNSGEFMRVGGSGTNETFGTGATNPWSGFIKQIIVSPFFNGGRGYYWALFDSSANKMGPGLVYQQVEPFTVEQQTPTPNNDAWFEFDEILYRGVVYFGTGFADDRAWFLSTTTFTPDTR